MTDTFSAKVNVIVEAVNEWQRGAINLTECKRQCDLTDAQYAVLFDRLYGVGSYTQTDRVREIAAKAVGTH